MTYLSQNLFMKVIPVFKVHDMRAALHHYTQILDFTCPDPNDNPDSLVVDLANEHALLQLTTCEADSLFGSVVNIWVEDVDALFAKYIGRGLDITKKKNSPVHQAPVDQTWGRREFYVTDADNNTLRFVRSIQD